MSEVKKLKKYLLFAIFSISTFFFIDKTVLSAENLAYEDSFGFASVGEGTIGGVGGEEKFVYTAAQLKEAVKGDRPTIVKVVGKIDLTNLFESSPGVTIDVGSNKTIIGTGKDAEITGGGLRIKKQKQVIIKNLNLTNALSFAKGERPDGKGGIITTGNTQANPGDFTEIDAINIESSEHIWIDHNKFTDDPWIASEVPQGKNRHDGLMDIKKGANWITLSNNIFTNHNKTSLIGHSDKNSTQDNNKLKITFAYNWFNRTDQRNPRVRFGEVHLLNNLYTDISSYGIGAGSGAKIYAEENVFVNTKRAWGHPNKVPDPMGYLLNKNNLLKNSCFDHDEPTGKYPAVPSDGVKWRPIDYYSYRSMAVDEVEEFVRHHAGPLN